MLKYFPAIIFSTTVQAVKVQSVTADDGKYSLVPPQDRNPDNRYILTTQTIDIINYTKVMKINKHIQHKHFFKFCFFCYRTDNWCGPDNCCDHKCCGGDDNTPNYYYVDGPVLFIYTLAKMSQSITKLCL